MSDEAPSGLEVTTSLRAPRVSIEDYPTGISVTVRATNTGSGRLVVRFDSAGAERAGGFGIRVLSTDGRTLIDTELPARDSVSVFGAGQTRRQRFLIPLGAGRTGGLPQGEYIIHARFAGRAAEPLRLSVIP